jgi:hypothetical protein
MSRPESALFFGRAKASIWRRHLTERHTIHYFQNRSSRPRLNRGITTYSETCGIAPSIDAREIGAFVEHGGIVVAEGEPVSSTNMIGECSNRLSLRCLRPPR